MLAGWHKTAHAARWQRRVAQAMFRGAFSSEEAQLDALFAKSAGGCARPNHSTHRPKGTEARTLQTRATGCIHGRVASECL